MRLRAAIDREGVAGANDVERVAGRWRVREPGRAAVVAAGGERAVAELAAEQPDRDRRREQERQRPGVGPPAAVAASGYQPETVHISLLQPRGLGSCRRPEVVARARGRRS